MNIQRVTLVLLGGLLTVGSSIQYALATDSEIDVVNWLPKSYVRDGSVSYQSQIQEAINEASKTGKSLRFLPMVYLVDELGFKIESSINLDLRGAIFQFKESCAADGSLFYGDSVSNVSILGGDIRRRIDAVPETKSIAVRGNMLVGENRKILVEGPEKSEIHVSDNIGVQD